MTALASLTTKASSENSLADLPMHRIDWGAPASLGQLIRCLPHTYLIHPGLVENIKAGTGIERDPTTNEASVDVPFHEVQKFVPNEYYRAVHHDNQRFLAEKQVFCNPFFKITAKLMEQMIGEIVDQEQRGEMSPEEAEQRYMQAYTILDKLIFEMLVISGEE